ncbi:MAG: MFS transporter [Gammaproteobacteria bacterium]|nr:MFS transporter [Gammaproteobacteria bacterium]
MEQTRTGAHATGRVCSMGGRCGWAGGEPGTQRSEVPGWLWGARDTVIDALNAAMKAVWTFVVGFGRTLGSWDFLALCGATFLVFNGFQLVASFQSYVIIFYVFGGDQDTAAWWIGTTGTVSAIATFAVISLATLLGTRIGKRRTFFLCIGISTLGYGLKWFCYDPTNPWLLLLPAPLIAFGLGSLFTLMGSMIADVCDQDELKTGERREGMYGAIFWWVVKLGMAAAIAASGYLLNDTGFDVDLGGGQSERTLFLMRLYDVTVPFVSSIIAIALIASYGITETRARETRAILEDRRGVR